jgi:hypothetical protein
MFRLSIIALMAAMTVASPGIAQTAAPAPAAQRPPLDPPAPLFFRSEWTGTPAQHPVTQKDLVDQQLELKLYGPSGKQIATASAGAPSMTGAAPPHVFTGLCEQTCAAALRDRNRYVDLSGLGKIRWVDKVSGLHRVHPILKLADGTWILGEHEDSNHADFHVSEFTLAESRWIKLDIEKVITRGNWLSEREVDLTKVDEIGFTSLMPGSGHGDGGFMDMGWIEVYGKPVPRTGR